MSLNLGTLLVNPDYPHQEKRHHEVLEGESGLAITEPINYLLELHKTISVLKKRKGGFVEFICSNIPMLEKESHGHCESHNSWDGLSFLLS